MSNLLLQVLNMSMTGSVVILFVMAARLLLKRLPKSFSYALWSVVLFRLLCPVSFSAPLSVLDVVEPVIHQSNENVSRVTYIPETPDLYADFVTVRPENNPVQQEESAEPAEQLKMTPMHAAALVWFAGAVGMLLYSVVKYLILKRKLIGAMLLEKNVYLADGLDTAFVLGIVQPRVYLPSGLSEKERIYILAHERCHIRRMDHVIKLLSYLALCIHWFNPLVWIAFILAGKDMEMSCDEAVIRKLGSEIRADYSASLLRLTTHKKILSGMPLAFGEGDTKSRILNMAKWKKPARWIVAVCAIVCIGVVTVCAFNPKDDQTMAEITRRTSDQPVGTGIGDLDFTYPAGLTSEIREVDNWTKEEDLRRLRNLPNRNPWDHHFIDNGVDFGGVVDFLVPENRKIRLEELNLPKDWKGLDYIAGSSEYPYAEMEYTLIKDGKDYIRMYLYTYSGRGYFLWFYTDQGDPAHKKAILESVELGGGRQGKEKTEYDEPVSLGLFNITIPKGYGYYRTETVILEIRKQDIWGNRTILGCVTARPKPNLPMETEEDLERWVQALGINMIGNGLSYFVSDETKYCDVFLRIEDSTQGIPVLKEQHYLYVAENIVYDLCLYADQMDRDVVNTILESIWIKDSSTVPAANKWVTAAAHSSVQIGLLPDGYNVGYDREQNIIFVWGSNAVGGIVEYPIPEGCYDPYDRHFFWLEEMGIPDFEDESLIYTGGMTAGDNGWLAEFASDVPAGTPATVHRRHTFYVVGDILYDIWFDMLKISRDTLLQLESAVHLPKSSSMETTDKAPEDIAYEKTLAVMDAVSNGSCHIISRQVFQDQAEYIRSYFYHDGNFLYIGEELEQTGKILSTEGLLILDEEWFTTENGQETSGEINWIPGSEEPEEPAAPWLGNRIWTKSFFTYMDTLTDEDGICYMFRYERPFEDSPDCDPHYFVNFSFDSEGNFQNVKLKVNLFRENEFTITESIHSLDPETVNTAIQKAYQQAIG